MFEKIKIKGRYILLCAVVLECLFQFDLKNLCGCGVALYGWALFETFVFKSENFKRCFLPSLAVTGYIIMYFFLPIIVTLIEFKPLTFKFEVPYLLWFNLLININIIILAYVLCLKVSWHKNILSPIWRYFGFFKKPSQYQILIFGSIGLFAIFYNVLIQKNQGSYDDMQKMATGGIFFLILKNLEQYAFIPLCLLFPKMYGENGTVKKWPVLVLLCMSFLISIASTRRSLIFLPLLTIAVIYIYNAIILNRRIVSTPKLVLICALFFVVSGPITDLAAAMSLNRHNLKSTSTFDDVIKLYNNKEKLHFMYNSLSAFAGKDNDNIEGWSEYYVDNIFLDRFCNLRVQDATLFYANKLGYDNKGMHEFARDFVMFRMPTFLSNSMNAKKVVRTSPTDYITETYFRVPEGVLGQRVGGDIGIGLCWLGYKYYIVAFIIYFAVFYFMSSLTLVNMTNTIIPIYVLSHVSKYFMYFVNSTGIFRSIDLLIRSGVSDIIIFCIILFFITRFTK